MRFSAGHRLPQHGGKCQYPHGHTYEADLFLESAQLTDEDWIVDFDIAKAAAREVLEEHFDHAFIVDSRDTELIAALRQVEPVKLYVLEERAPTAERIAEELYRLLRDRIPELVTVRVWETEQQYGEFGAPQA